MLCDSGSDKVRVVFGIVDIVSMLGLYFGLPESGMLGLRIFYIFFALVGAGFTYWALMWKISSDNKRIMIRPAFGSQKEVPYADIKKIEVHKKKKGDALIYYTIHGVDDEELVKVYPTMSRSGDLLARFKKLGIKIEEVNDR